MKAALELEVDPAFTTMLDRLSSNLRDVALEAMQKGMEEVAERTQSWRDGFASSTHRGEHSTWLLPGIYPDGEEGARFEWEATGLTSRSIQGYAVGKGEPQDLAGVTDSFGRWHTTAAKQVAPVPTDLASDRVIVGVLTMTSSYAPEESQSSATLSDEYAGKVGVQGFEMGGAYDGHVKAGQTITVLGLEQHKSILERRLAEELARALI